jgi:hypothetical protein
LQGQTKTSFSGRFTIEFSRNDASLNNNDEFPVDLRLAKNTSFVSHRFLCSEGTRDCTARLSNGSTVGNNTSITTLYLQHLEFNSPLAVIDDTTVPFTGKVTVAGTNTPSNPLGCPLLGVKVCLKDHSVRNQLTTLEAVCDLTDNEGRYDLPAVIGTFVSPYVDYMNHTFRAFDLAHETMFQSGIEIKAETDYVGYNLQDVTKANLTIEVAGGLCNRVLGRSSIRLKMQGCTAWPGQVLEQTNFRHYHQVISQIVELKLEAVHGFTDNTTRNIFVEPFQSDVRTADLRSQENSKSAPNSPQGVDSTKTDREQGILLDSPETEALKEEQKSESEDFDSLRVRFQYDGTDIIKTSFGNMNTSSCVGDKIDDPTYSYHVVSKLEVLVVGITVLQDFGYADIPTCSKYSPDTSITIQNYIGVANSTTDEQWLESIKASSFSQQAVGLQKCNPSCTRPLQYDNSGEGAFAVEILIAGQPNPVFPYSKLLVVTMPDSGVSHTSEVVIAGDYELPGGFSVGLPSHSGSTRGELLFLLQQHEIYNAFNFRTH